ncbi:hypothetical protein [Leptolyngbya sp. PCC 6406]|uniref:hypothetical protein n=1 Tax=Leptolyngbya sp. PCC 6406 TaxID=1173264 RepID=UPI0012DE29B1|nr:hypothetical protein [Leptolyngbya sp. PCC 6406]
MTIVRDQWRGRGAVGGGIGLALASMVVCDGPFGLVPEHRALALPLSAISDLCPLPQDGPTTELSSEPNGVKCDGQRPVGDHRTAAMVPLDRSLAIAPPQAPQFKGTPYFSTKGRLSQGTVRAPLPAEEWVEIDTPLEAAPLEASAPEERAAGAESFATREIWVQTVQNLQSTASPALEETWDGEAIATNSSAIDIDPAIIESSPVLRRWLQSIPDVAADIRHDPAFRPRLRVGYAQFPSNNQTSGFYLGVQDFFVGRTPLTLSADYSQNANRDGDHRASYGIDAQYYLLPLGWYGNVAPVLGYRHLDTPTYTVEGLNVGFRIVLIPSRTGAADLALTQTWVAPGTQNVVGLTTFSVGYAVTSQLRISTDIQTQNAPGRQDSRVGVFLEWML